MRNDKEMVETIGKQILCKPEAHFDKNNNCVSININKEDVVLKNGINFNSLLHLRNLNFRVLKGFKWEMINKIRSLKVLKLVRMDIPHIPKNLFQMFPELEQLTISESKIHELPDGIFSNLIALRIINLQNNNLTKIHVFNLPRLSEIHLHGNKIKSLGDIALQQVPNLNRLTLGSNNIKSIDLTIIGNWEIILNQLKSFNLQGNPLPKELNKNYEDFIFEKITRDIKEHNQKPLESISLPDEIRQFNIIQNPSNDELSHMFKICNIKIKESKDEEIPQIIQALGSISSKLSQMRIIRSIPAQEDKQVIQQLNILNDNLVMFLIRIDGLENPELQIVISKPVFTQSITVIFNAYSNVISISNEYLKYNIQKLIDLNMINIQDMGILTHFNSHFSLSGSKPPVDVIQHLFTLYVQEIIYIANNLPEYTTMYSMNFYKFVEKLIQNQLLNENLIHEMSRLIPIVPIIPSEQSYYLLQPLVLIFHNKKEYREEVKTYLEHQANTFSTMQFYYSQLLREFFDGDFDKPGIIVKRKEKTKSHLAKCSHCNSHHSVNFRICPNCNEDVEYCEICKLSFNEISKKSECPECSSKFHHTHFQEWIRIKGKCPVCKKLVKI